MNVLSVKGHFECAVVECIEGKAKLVIVSIYRPPKGKMRLFLDRLEVLLFINQNFKMFSI